MGIEGTNEVPNIDLFYDPRAKLSLRYTVCSLKYLVITRYNLLAPKPCRLTKQASVEACSYKCLETADS